MSETDDGDEEGRATTRDAREGAGADEGDDLPSVDSIIGTFMQEASLWPVLVVALGSSGALGGAMIVLAAIDRNPFAAGALLLLFAMTVDVTIRAWRDVGYRNLARMVGLIWIVAFAFAALAVWTGIAYSS